MISQVRRLAAENARLRDEAATCRCPDQSYADREISRLAQENARLRAALEWQPIETAPKNGTRVLLWWTTRGASTGVWSDEGEGWRGDMDLCVPRDQHRCTRWLPLPAPPGSGGTDGE